MKLSAPKIITFLVAVVIAVLGVIASFIGTFQPYALWIVLVAFVLLAVGNLFEGI